VQKIKEYQQSMQQQNACFRVSIRGSGCSGYQYNFVFDEKNDADNVRV